MTKRILELLAAAAGLIILAPLLVTSAILVKIDSPGPAFYRGIRVGRYGRRFKIWKFRTMVVNAEKLGGTSTGKNDARITTVGRVLRRYKFDELPQLINVLKGEMSIVGPRPEVEEYTRLYTEEEKEILSVRPGITDLASLEYISLDEVLGIENVDQVYAERVRPAKNRLRLKYVRNQSLSLDMVIIWRTLRRLVSG